MKLSVVMPVYNEKETILKIVDRVLKEDLVYELIIVDDKSNDGTTELLKEARVCINNGYLSLAGHRPTLSSQVQQHWFLFSNILRKGGFQVPLLSEIEKESGLRKKQLSALIIPALKSGDLIQLSQKRYMLAETRDAIAAAIMQLANAHACFTVIDAKAQLGLGRGLTIEILEHLDSIHFTRRKNEGRELFL